MNEYGEKIDKEREVQPSMLQLSVQKSPKILEEDVSS
jgi:hypothetical protein